MARWISEGDVTATVNLADAIDALEAGLRHEAEGGTAAIEKSHARWGEGSTAHTLGAVVPAFGLLGVKSWAHTPGGATPLLIVWDAASGDLVAVVEAFALGQLRTAAATGVATRWLARPDAKTLAIIGSGKQAPGQVAAVVAVRPIERVLVHSPSADHRDALVDRIRAARPDLDVEATASVAGAVEGADVVVTATRASSPFLTGDALGPDTHVNAIGAITPERAELAPDVVAGATIVVDSVRAARELASELTGVDELIPLAQVVAAGRTAGMRPSGRTVFKAMGTGLADLSVGALVLERAAAEGRGRPLPRPERSTPDLWSTR